MFDPARFMLLYAYFYGRCSGILNFEIDMRTGRARLTRLATVYSALANAVTVGMVPWLSTSSLMQAYWTRAGELHEYLFLTILGGRILCVCLTLFTRWRQRAIFVCLVNVLRRVTLKRPHVRELCRRGIISKVIGTLFSELLQMTLGLMSLREHLTFGLFLSNLIFYTITALVNIIISHYFFALLLIRGHYRLLIEELRLLLDEVAQLECENRKGVFVLKCCALADRLEAIAHDQFQLQSLLRQVTSLFGPQTLCMALSYYMSTISIIYFMFSEIRGTSVTLGWSYWALFIIIFEAICYFGDNHISIDVVYGLLEAHGEMVRLLSEHTVLAPGLDVRLETVVSKLQYTIENNIYSISPVTQFESFKLQLAWNPLKIPVLQLYNMEKSRAVVMASSVITSTLVLIQYDLKNYSA